MTLTVVAAPPFLVYETMYAELALRPLKVMVPSVPLQVVGSVEMTEAITGSTFTVADKVAVLVQAVADVLVTVTV